MLAVPVTITGLQATGHPSDELKLLARKHLSPSFVETDFRETTQSHIVPDDAAWLSTKTIDDKFRIDGAKAKDLG